MIKFLDWWFRETWKLPHGFIVLLVYLAVFRTIALKYIPDIDYMTMDGVVFSILTSITMAAPQLKEMILKDEEQRKKNV